MRDGSQNKNSNYIKSILSQFALQLKNSSHLTLLKNSKPKSGKSVKTPSAPALNKIASKSSSADLAQLGSASALMV